MDLMEQLIENLGKLPDGTPDDVKTGIKSLFQQVNQKAGKAATDLESYKTGALSYQKLKKKLAEANLDESQLDTIADQLGVTKTLEDELAFKEITNKELNKKVKELNEQLVTMKMEGKLGSKVSDLAKAYKTPDGKTVKLSDRFIDKKELYKPIDLEQDVLVQDRIDRVLKAAYESQSAFMKEVGMEFPSGQPLHKVPLGDGNFGSGKALDEGAVIAVLKGASGSQEAAARALTMYENAGKLYSGSGSGQ